MLTDTLRIEHLSENNTSDFYKVLSLGEFGDCCFCVFWWQNTHDGWADRTCEQNRNFREILFSQKIYDGFLLYIDDKPQGWCQCGPRDKWPTLLQKYSLEPDSLVWAVNCFVLNPEMTGRGYAHRFLGEILRALKLHGVARVQAFPHLGKDLKNEEVWPGPISLYEKAGFTTIKLNDRRPILELTL